MNHLSTHAYRYQKRYITDNVVTVNLELINIMVLEYSKVTIVVHKLWTAEDIQRWLLVTIVPIISDGVSVLSVQSFMNLL